MCPERYVARKPKSLSFEDAASLPLAAMTALQAMKKYKGSLAGKTVFIPAGRKSESEPCLQRFYKSVKLTSFTLQLVGQVHTRASWPRMFSKQVK